MPTTPVQSAALEIMPAIYNKLAPGGILDATLASYGFTGVFNWRNVPQQPPQPFDYIVIGDVLAKPNNTFGKRGYDSTITIHLWSRQPSSVPTEQGIARINQLLDQQTLSLSTHQHVSTMFDQEQYIPEPDGLTLHGTVRYQIYIQE